MILSGYYARNHGACCDCCSFIAKHSRLIDALLRHCDRFYQYGELYGDGVNGCRYRDGDANSGVWCFTGENPEQRSVEICDVPVHQWRPIDISIIMHKPNQCAAKI